MIIWLHPLSERPLFSQPASLSLSLHRGPKKDCSSLVLVTSSLQLVLPVLQNQNQPPLSGSPLTKMVKVDVFQEALFTGGEANR